MSITTPSTVDPAACRRTDCWREFVQSRRPARGASPEDDDRALVRVDRRVRRARLVSGMRTLSQLRLRDGESARADARPHRLGPPGPATENVLVRSGDRARTAQAVTRSRPGAVGCRHVARPSAARDRSAELSRDGGRDRAGRRVAARRHGTQPDAGAARLQHFVISGLRTRTRASPSSEAGGGSDDNAITQLVNERSAPGRADLDPDHARDPGARVRRAGRRVGAAAARADLGRGRARRARAGLADRPQRLLDRPGRGPDRSGGRRRLLAVLHPPRARRAPRRREPPTRRWPRPRRPSAGRSWSPGRRS